MTHALTRSNADAFALQEAIRDQLGDQLIDLDTHHHFGGGVYVREIRMVAGTVLVGKMHRGETMNMLVSGTMVLMSGDGPKEVTGPYIFTSPPMNKKAGYCKTDVVFITMHPTDETDPEILEEELTIPEDQALEFTRLLEEVT